MPFYLARASYNTAAIKAMVASPSDREAAVRKLADSAGVKIHHFLFALGEDDVVVITEAPDDVTAAAFSMTVAAGGSMSGIATTKLLTSKEAMAAMEQAKSLAGDYAPPAA